MNEKRSHWADTTGTLIAKEVFDHAEFENGVKDHFILVALDFPNGAEAKAKVPNPERNKELQEQYGIRGFPTILLMSAEGEVFGVKVAAVRALLASR